jgi:hypothetical protein
MGRKDAVKFLVEHGADVNQLTDGVFLFLILFFSLFISWKSFCYLLRGVLFGIYGVCFSLNDKVGPKKLEIQYVSLVFSDWSHSANYCCQKGI